MQITLREYDDVVQGIYEAALQPEQLQDVLERVCTLMGGFYGTLFSWTRPSAAGGFFFTTFPAHALERYQRIGHEDPHVVASRAKGLMEEGVAVSNDTLITEEELFASRLYKEIWQPLGIRWMCGGVVFGASDTHHLPTVLSVHRPIDALSFSASDVDIVRRLLCHFSRALGVMFHLRDEELKVASSRAALDQLSAGIVLLGQAGEIEFVNRAAQQFVEMGHAVTMRHETATGTEHLALSSRLRVRERAFQAAICSALQPLSRDVAEPFSRALLLDGVEGEALCAIHIAPLPVTQPFNAGNSSPRAIVFIYDLKDAGSLAPEVLSDAFELTPAESRVALEVLRGGDAKTMARRLSVSPSTVRTQLQHVYQKTQVTHRADLLKLLLSLAVRRH